MIFGETGSEAAGAQPLEDLLLVVAAGEDDVAAADGGDFEARGLGRVWREERLLEVCGEFLPVCCGFRSRCCVRGLVSGGRRRGRRAHLDVALDVADERAELVVHARVGVDGHGALAVARDKVRVADGLGGGL